MSVKKVRLGRTGYYVSQIGFGALPIQRLEFDAAIELIKWSTGQGVNFIDSANGYTNSEEKIGKALKQIATQEIILATKTQARDAATAYEHVQTSLKRLQVDFIHIYQLHAVNDYDSLEKVLSPGGALEGLKRAKAEGKIGHISITGHRSDVLVKAIETGEFATVQVPYNYIETDAAHELFPLARKLDVGIILMKPFGGGMLQKASLSLKYILQQEGVVPIPGFETVDEIKEVLDIATGNYELSTEEWQEIENVKKELGKRFCHRCNYCAPCPQGIPIPQAMIMHTMLRRMGLQHFTHNWGKPLLEKAQTCIKCGACEPRCPYNLPIREVIEANVKQINNLLAIESLERLQ